MKKEKKAKGKGKAIIEIALAVVILALVFVVMVQMGSAEVQTASLNGDYGSNKDTNTIIIQDAEIEIEAEKTEPIEFEDVLFTVRAPPNQLFNFSTTHSEDVVMTSKEDNPLCLAPGEVVTMDTVGGTFSATTDEDGLFKFVVFFFENRTYTFRVWYDAATYEDAEENKKDDIDINVSEFEVEIKVSDNAVAEIGEEVVIRGISNIGKSVDIVINDLLEFDNVTGSGTGMDGLYGVSIYTVPTFIASDAFSDGEIGIKAKGDEFEINAPGGKIVFDMPSTCIIGENVAVKGSASEGDSVDIAMDDIVKAVDIPIENGTFYTVISTAGYSPGSYKIEGFIDGNYSIGEDVSGQESDGYTTILLIFSGLTVNISTNVTVPGGSFVINGTATSTDYVDLITISPKGGGGTGLYEKSYPDVPGITNESIPVRNNSFSRTINVSEHANVGKYVIWVSVPGRDGYYGNWYGEGVNTSDKLIKQIIEDFCGGDTDGLRSKTQDQILAILEDATIDVVGNDDLASIAELNIGEREFEARWNTTGKEAGVYEIDVYVDCKVLTSEMEGTNVEDVISEYGLEPDDKAWIVLVNQFSSGLSKGSDDLYLDINKAFVGMEEAGIPTSPEEGNYNDYLYHPDHWYNRGKGVIGDNASVTYKVLIGEMLNFTGNCTGKTIVGYAPEEIEGKTYGTASHDYYTEYELAVEGTYYVDVDANSSYDTGIDVLLSVEEPKMRVKIRDEKGKEIESTTIGKNITVDLETNLFDDDVVKLKVKDQDGLVCTYFSDTIKNVNGKTISTVGWRTGTYELWVETVEDKARGLDIESARYTITLRKPEIEIESEMELPPVGEEVVFTVIAPPYAFFNFSASHPEDVVMAAKGNNPLNLSEGEEVRMDEVGGAFNATTDYEGLYNFVVYFTEGRIYTFRVWYDAPTYEAAWHRDQIDIEVGEITTAVTVPDTSVVVVGEDVTIRGISPAGDCVDIYIDGFLWFDDEPLIDGEFEVILDTCGMVVGSHDVHVYVDCPFSIWDEDELPEGIEEDGSKELRLVSPGLLAKQRRNVVAVGDDYIVEGMATGVDEVDVVLIGPNGFTAVPLGVENGLEFLSTSVSEGNAFNEDICIPDDADFGEYKVGVFTPGRDGVYGTTWCGEGELLDAILAEYGIEVEDLVGKNQTQLLDMITAATIDKVGSDDLAEILNFTTELPYVRFSDVRDVPVGEPLKVNGVTNRVPGTTITINSTIEYLTPHPHLIPAKVKWPSPNYGVFNVTINTTDAKSGTYTLIADDGEGNINITTVEILPAISIFDTGPGTYPSIFGMHNGTIIPSQDINVSKLYTYPCPGTGGHTEHIKIWNTSNWNVTATWNGYAGDWHNISFNETFVLYKNEEYNYTIKTGSYPQIIHNQTHTTLDGSFINCTEFTDANGKIHDNWIPAIKLFK